MVGGQCATFPRPHVVLFVILATDRKLPCYPDSPYFLSLCRRFIHPWELLAFCAVKSRQTWPIGGYANLRMVHPERFSPIIMCRVGLPVVDHAVLH